MWLQLATTRRTRRSFRGWLRGYIGHRARMHHLLQRARLQAFASNTESSICVKLARG
jgi:hypothetical protein